MGKRPKWWLRAVAFFWPLTWIGGRLYRVPVLGKFLVLLTSPLFSPKKQHLTYVPIHHEIEGTGSTYLPRKIVEELIRRASHRAIIHHCTCRLERGCTEHPIELGCLLMGDGAAEIDANIARQVGVEEALEHLDRALDSGLIPLVGRAPIDNLIYGVKNRGRLLTTCYCCTCCCTILSTGKYLPDAVHASLVPLAGLSIDTDPKNCTACGTCVTSCFMGALSVENGVLVRDHHRCKSCGLCVTACPTGANRETVDDIEKAIDDIFRRIEKFVDYT
jgi:ferredoxin